MSTKVNPVSLECRDMRHGWRSEQDVVLTERRGIVRIFTRSLCCVRCGTKRIDTYEVVKSQVSLLHTKYKYPDGYHIQGGISVSTARGMLWANLLEGR